MCFSEDKSFWNSTPKYFSLMLQLIDHSPFQIPAWSLSTFAQLHYFTFSYIKLHFPLQTSFVKLVNVFFDPFTVLFLPTLLIPFSSVNKPLQLLTSSSFMKIKKVIGVNTDSCGTPLVTTLLLLVSYHHQFSSISQIVPIHLKMLAFSLLILCCILELIHGTLVEHLLHTCIHR